MSDSNEHPSFDNTPTGKLTKLLGFDPAKASRLTGVLYAEVVREISKERTDAAKAKAKDLLTKAISLREQAAQAEKKFRSEIQKFDKELAKVINSVQGILDGREPQAEGDPTPSE